MTELFGLDPGKTNGVLQGWYDDDEPFTIVHASEIVGSAKEIGALFAFWCDNIGAGRGGSGRVIAESFISHGHHQFHVDANFAIKPLGAMEYVAAQRGVPITYRNPGPPEKSITDALLKSSGYWIKGGKGHMRAILRHVLQQLIDEGHGPTMRKFYSREV